VDFGKFNLDKAKEMAEGLLGGEELNAHTVVKLLEGLLKEPDRGKELVERVKLETKEDSSPLEVIVKLYSYGKKLGII
jgi:hypothetical protein